jgi:hypothetical protein
MEPFYSLTTDYPLTSTYPIKKESWKEGKKTTQSLLGSWLPTAHLYPAIAERFPHWPNTGLGINYLGNVSR